MSKQEEHNGFKKALLTKMSKETTDEFYGFENALLEFLIAEVGPDNYWFQLDPSEDGAIGTLHVWGEKFKGDENEE